VARILITGCSSGVGRAAAVELSRRGHEVVATARNPASLDDLDVREKLVLDVTNDISVKAAVEAAGRVDVLINNAGIGLWGPVEATPLRQAQHLFETNVWGPMRMINAVAPQMRERRSGKIVQISSAAGRTGGGPLLGYYSASKNALEVLSRALRIELGAFGVSVVIVELGAIKSDFPKNRVTTSSAPYEGVVEAFTKQIQGARGDPKSSEYVAERLAEIVAEPAPKLLYESTPDVAPIVNRRLAQTDEQWEAQARQSLGL